MKEVAYVSDAASRTAREIEAKFQGLPSSAGILCVGVVAEPIEGGQTKAFTVFLGVTRGVETETGFSIIKQTLEKEIRSGLFSITAHVFKGVSGAARDQTVQGPRTLQA